ncbi:unnamed protein product [Urochloa decumbens]|uniref:Oxidoreductase-like domain-containing protein n=1 Tax=Urochloa decumbens TaxID=240449 RepID=A0ABC9FV94_9POAL
MSAEIHHEAKRDVPCASSFVRAGLWHLDSDQTPHPIRHPPPRPFFPLRRRDLSACMLGAVLRVPAPIPLPTPTRPLLALRRCRIHSLPPGTPMASASTRDGGAGAAKPDAAPSPAPAPAPLPEPPEKPLPGDCCGSGCVRCVWDIYFDELDAYDKALAAHAAASGPGGKDDSADAKPSSDGATAKP